MVARHFLLVRLVLSAAERHNVSASRSEPACLMQATKLSADQVVTRKQRAVVAPDGDTSPPAGDREEESLLEVTPVGAAVFGGMNAGATAAVETYNGVYSAMDALTAGEESPVGSDCSQDAEGMLAEVTKCFEDKAQREKDQAVEKGILGIANVALSAVPVAGAVVNAAVDTYHAFEGANAVNCEQLGHTVSHCMSQMTEKKIDEINSKVSKLEDTISETQAKVDAGVQGLDADLKLAQDQVQHLELQRAEAHTQLTSQLNSLKETMVSGLNNIRDNLDNFQRIAKARHQQVEMQWGRAEKQVFQIQRTTNDLRRDLTRLSHKLSSVQHSLLSAEFVERSIELLKNFKSISAADEDYAAAVSSHGTSMLEIATLIGTRSETEAEVTRINSELREQSLEAWKRARNAIASISVTLEESDYLMKSVEISMSTVLRDIVANHQCGGVLKKRRSFRDAATAKINDDGILSALTSALTIAQDLFSAVAVTCGPEMIPNDDYRQSMQSIKAALSALEVGLGRDTFEDQVLTPWLPLLCPLSPGCYDAASKISRISGIDLHAGVQVTAEVIAFDPLHEQGNFFRCTGKLRMSGFAVASGESGDDIYSEGLLGGRQCPVKHQSFSVGQYPIGTFQGQATPPCNELGCTLQDQLTRFLSVDKNLFIYHTCDVDGGVCNWGPTVMDGRGWTGTALSGKAVEDNNRASAMAHEWPSPCCYNRYNQGVQLTLTCPKDLKNWQGEDSVQVTVKLVCTENYVENTQWLAGGEVQGNDNPQWANLYKFQHNMKWMISSAHLAEEEFDVDKHGTCHHTGGQTQSMKLEVEQDYDIDDSSYDFRSAVYMATTGDLASKINAWAHVIKHPECAVACKTFAFKADSSTDAACFQCLGLDGHGMTK